MLIFFSISSPCHARTYSRLKSSADRPGRVYLFCDTWPHSSPRIQPHIFTALHLSAQKGRLDEIIALIEAGADVDKDLARVLGATFCLARQILVPPLPTSSKLPLLTQADTTPAIAHFVLGLNKRNQTRRILVAPLPASSKPPLLMQADITPAIARFVLGLNKKQFRPGGYRCHHCPHVRNLRY